MLTAGFKNVRVTNMQGHLDMESPEEFWCDFTTSAPPLAKLFEVLGEENTRRTGEVFVELIKKKCGNSIPCMTSEACIGVGIA